MNLSFEIQNILSIPDSHIKIQSEKEALCLVHSSWLKFVCKGLNIPQEVVQTHVASENLLSSFKTSSELSTRSGWKILTVNLWRKHEGTVFRPLKPHEKYLSDASLSFSHLIHYVTRTNYKNLWAQAWKKYYTVDPVKKTKSKLKYNDCLREVLYRLGKPEKSQRNDGLSIYEFQNFSEHGATSEMHPNLLHLYCVIENENYFLLLGEHVACSLKDCLMFSPHILSGSVVRPLFVIFQFLQIVRSLRSAGLFIGQIHIENINIKNNLWLQVTPALLESFFSEADKFKNDVHSNEELKNSETNEIVPAEKNLNHEHNRHLSTTVQNWIDGRISNYDYLMELNKFAGRQMNNPKCHYVMPWIMDFSVPEGGWRDLSKSKFRLNKGDKQLDLIYQSATDSTGTLLSHNSSSTFQHAAITVPHHTTEVLADITYYVYKARRMPKFMLCQHVRRKWVPAEYPSTIERLQEWTPDECIPEFFSDPSIFYSVHADLSDLGFPWWCSSPEDFIQKHRNALESHHVSERLHQWIDLVFGYKLTGGPAIKSKNLCLPLVDCHTSIQNHGMVQLFSTPHPHKLGKSIFLRSLAPKTFRNKVLKAQEARDSGDDETSSESYGKSIFLKGFRSKSVPSADSGRGEPRPENQTIVLPKDFNPLSTLSHVEVLNTFKSWLGKQEQRNIISISSEDRFRLLEKCQIEDMLVLGCIISEITMFSYCKTSPQFPSLKERCQHNVNILNLHKQDVPRAFRKIIKLLLHVKNSNDVDILDESYNHPIICESGLPFPSPQQLLLPQVQTIPFPAYLPELYNFVQGLNLYNRKMNALCKSNGNEDKDREMEKLSEKQVFFSTNHLQDLLPSLNSESLDIIIPYLQEMFENKHTALLSTWHMFWIIAQALGAEETCKKFLKLLIKVFETENPSPKHLKLYHRTFLIQIIIGLGLKNFLSHFITILIEAIGGCKDYSPGILQSETAEQSPEVIPDPNGMVDDLENLRMCNIETEARLSASTENVNAYIENEDDMEIFDMDLKEDESLKESDIDAKNSVAEPLMDNACDAANELDTKHDSDLHEEKSSDLLNVTDNACYSQSAPNFTTLSDWIVEKENISCEPEESQKLQEISISNELKHHHPESVANEPNVSDVSAESMIWLAQRLGPVLTARYLTRNLLRMLTLCYDSPEKRQLIFISPDTKGHDMLSTNCRWFRGDTDAFKVLKCLSRIAVLYGEHFILIQYIKHIVDLLHLCRKKVPATLESGLHGAMALLQHIIPYISDSMLMDHLQEVFLKDIIFLVLRLISSCRVVFPGSAKSRTMITYRILDVMYIIGVRIGFEMTRKHLSTALQKFFACFDKVYDENGEIRSHCFNSEASHQGNVYPYKEQSVAEIRETFSPEMAFLSYIPFCKLVGGIYMERTIKNNELLHSLCLKYDENKNSSKFTPSVNYEYIPSNKGGHQRNQSLGQDEEFVSGVFGKNVNVVGNRLDVQHEDSNAIPPLHSSVFSNLTGVPKVDINLIKKRVDSCKRHLRGNWLAYWDHETGRSEKDCHFNFKQIKLQTFVGHVGAVRAIEVLDNENSFITSSKDKTVKLWSLRSCGDGSANIPCQWTYTQHRKSVFAVSFLHSLRLVGSCDSVVHVWDPFLGSCIKQLESPKGNHVTVLESMPAPSSVFLAATTNSTVKFLDARTCKYMHEFKVNVGTTGLIRALAVSPNGNHLAIGYSTGMLSVLDARTGYVIGTWIGHEGEILQLKPLNNKLFVTSSLDHSLAVWEYGDTQPKMHLKGPMEPVTSICFYGNEVISATTGNRIGLHSLTDSNVTYSSTRLRSETFKGVLTTMNILPLNRLLLLGTDNGSVVLLC